MRPAASMVIYRTRCSMWKPKNFRKEPAADKALRPGSPDHQSHRQRARCRHRNSDKRFPGQTSTGPHGRLLSQKVLERINTELVRLSHQIPLSTVGPKPARLASTQDIPERPALDVRLKRPATRRASLPHREIECPDTLGQRNQALILQPHHGVC